MDEGKVTSKKTFAKVQMLWPATLPVEWYRFFNML